MFMIVKESSDTTLMNALMISLKLNRENTFRVSSSERNSTIELIEKVLDMLNTNLKDKSNFNSTPIPSNENLSFSFNALHFLHEYLKCENVLKALEK